LPAPGGTPRLLIGGGGRIFSITTTGVFAYAIDAAGDPVWTQVDPMVARNVSIDNGYGRHGAACAGTATPWLVIDAGEGVVRLTGADLEVDEP
jgi:hypothetical protein